MLLDYLLGALLISSISPDITLSTPVSMQWTFLKILQVSKLLGTCIAESVLERFPDACPRDSRLPQLSRRFSVRMRYLQILQVYVKSLKTKKKSDQCMSGQTMHRSFIVVINIKLTMFPLMRH